MSIDITKLSPSQIKKQAAKNKKTKWMDQKQKIVMDTLVQYGGSIMRTAEALGVDRHTVKAYIVRMQKQQVGDNLPQG
jgi:transcriptional regulator of acetoin/glycerol metabolism